MKETTDLVILKLDTARTALMEAKTIQDTKKLPGASGIYFLLKEDSVLYVGASKNLKKRWEDHSLRKFLNVNKVVLKYFLIDEPFFLESRLIDKLCPPLNNKSWGYKYVYHQEMLGIKPIPDDDKTAKLRQMVSKLKKIVEEDHERYCSYKVR